MVNIKALRHSIVAATTVALLVLGTTMQVGAEGFAANYIYSLSNFTGTVPYFWARIFVDNEHFETYVASGNTVDIFDRNGMEVYEFATDSGSLYDVAVIPDGDILILTSGDHGMQLVRCNYRGEPKSTTAFSGVPSEFGKDARFNRMVYRDGRLYLADLGEMKLMVVDTDGVFIQGYDIAALLQFSEEEKRDTGMNGFTLDGAGNVLFTISAMGKAFVLS